MSLLITIVCFAISAGMLISLLTLLKRSKKMKKLIACVDQIGDEARFFPAIGQFIDSIQDPEFAAKGEILKLIVFIIFVLRAALRRTVRTTRSY